MNIPEIGRNTVWLEYRFREWGETGKGGWDQVEACPTDI